LRDRPVLRGNSSGLGADGACGWLVLPSTPRLLAEFVTPRFAPSHFFEQVQRIINLLKKALDFLTLVWARILLQPF
jgi:hypothetical protein